MIRWLVLLIAVSLLGGCQVGSTGEAPVPGGDGWSVIAAGYMQVPGQKPPKGKPPPKEPVKYYSGFRGDTRRIKVYHPADFLAKVEGFRSKRGTSFSGVQPGEPRPEPKPPGNDLLLEQHPGWSSEEFVPVGSNP